MVPTQSYLSIASIAETITPGSAAMHDLVSKGVEAIQKLQKQLALGKELSIMEFIGIGCVEGDPQLRALWVRRERDGEKDSLISRCRAFSCSKLSILDNRIT